MQSHVKYPEITVTLLGTDGNAFALISKVRSALRHGNVHANEIRSFTTEAMAGDYDHVLQTILATVNVH